MNQSTRSHEPLVLVVDDNAANCELARATLEDEGLRVLVESGGQAGVAAFAKQAPDCVLLDVRMPDVDGFAACRQIRALPGGQDVPVIFLTALRDVETFDQALRAGGDDFLTKPVRPTELVVRVQTALKLRQTRAELREHYDLLKHQRDDLLRLQLQKERLMAFVVHDLKNPVNTMDLHAQILERAQIPASVRESVVQIRHEAKQLNRLIMNLLDISRAEEGKLVPHRRAVDLHALVGAVVRDLGASAAERGVTLETAVAAPMALADPDLLARVITNLVENAIHHAPSRTAVCISSSAQGEELELRVRDAGKGIPPELRERIFDPFLQAEVPAGSTNTRGGRGLGLTFCRLVAEAHGGRIWVEDASPGATLCLRLPAS